MNIPTIKQAEETIKIPASSWKGNCHGIANKLLESGLVCGKLRYGSWLGPVEKGSMFVNRPRGYIHHGWIEQINGDIIDPTRFEFEQKEPYIYVGKNDFYDAGSNTYLLNNMRPAPKYSKDARQETLHIEDEEAFMFVADMLGSPTDENDNITITINQAFWLANLPLQILGKLAKPVYLALIECGQRALIPMDNRDMVLEEE
jgi:hypothetical protein